MLKTQALAIPRTRKITTVCYGRLWSGQTTKIWKYFPWNNDVSEGYECDRAECIIFSYFMDLISATTKKSNQRKSFTEPFALRWDEKMLTLRSKWKTN